MSEQEAFTQAYLSVRKDVERFALYVCRNRIEAKDVLQEALASACMAWRKIGDAEHLRPYINSAVVRVYRRGRDRSARYEPIVDVDSMRCESAAPDTVADMNRLRDAIAALHDEQRIPLLLAEIEGWPLQEIADTLGIGLSAVKMRVKRGRDQLRAQLTDPVKINTEERNDRA
ncbi:MAG: sigma-70 family RNA polymerase sigma factor [Bacteroidetes bacterium]|nr:sigma-70 family RNA polymerase sigma factor [Bacteroidota bacterium]